MVAAPLCRAVHTCVQSSASRNSIGRSRPHNKQSYRGRRTTAGAVVEPSQLAAIAAEPVVEVAVLAGVGALCAKQGLLPLQGRRFLSGLVMNVFTPALLFSKLGASGGVGTINPALLFSQLGASVDVAEAIRLWPLAANMVACHVTGLGLGWLQVKTLGTPASLAPQVTVMTAVGNIGNLPLVLIPALLSRPGVLELITASSSSSSGGLSGFSSVGGNLDVAAATNMGLTYVMLGFFYASFIQFPLGYLLLQRKPGAHPQQQPHQQRLLLQPAAAGSAAAPASTAAAQLVQPVSPTQQDRVLLQAQQQQLQPAQQQQLQLPPQPHLPQQSQQGQGLMVLRGVFTPPVLACLLAMPVASLPVLRSALFSPGGDLKFLGDVTTLLGAPLIPCLFLVLGANLAEGPGAAQVPSRTVLGLLVSKLLVHPLLGLGGVLAALHTGLLPSDTDPLMVLVMLLVWATPTAVLTHSLATMLQNGEDQVSLFLFWQYLAALVSLPACLALYLQLLQSGLLSAASG